MYRQGNCFRLLTLYFWLTLKKGGLQRQQYQRLEAKGNPRLDTLELIARGLKGEVMLIPQEKLAGVKVLLADNGESYPVEHDADAAKENVVEENALANDPWQALLGDSE